MLSLVCSTNITKQQSTMLQSKPTKRHLELVRKITTFVLSAKTLQPVFHLSCAVPINRISQLPRAQLERGVITASAGNHAQGVLTVR